MGTTNAQDRFIRSVADQSPRPSDELARPRQVQRESHRGWELNNEHITVVSLGNPEQTLFAMREAQAAWNDMSHIVDYISVRHRHPDFGLGSIQVVINSDPPTQRNQSDVITQLAGSQTSIELYAAEDAKLKAMRQPLRAAIAASMLRTAEIDRHVPTWICDGIASYAATQGLTDIGLSPKDIASSAAKMPSGGIGLSQWRGRRIAPDKLAPAADIASTSNEQAADQILFLLTAEDGVHAAKFLNIVRAVVDEGNKTALSDRPVRTRPENIPEPPVPPALATYLESLGSKYEHWQKEPLMGVPRIDGALSPDQGVAEKQKQLLFVLKLCRRLETPQEAKSSVKVTTFDRNERTATPVTSRSGEQTHPAITTTAELLEQLDKSSGNQPFSTLLPNGHLIISTFQRAELEAQLAVNDRYFRIFQDANKLKVSVPLNSREELQAWLEEDPKNPDRPIARFTFGVRGATVKPASATTSTKE